MNSFWIFHRQTGHSPRIAAAARVSCPVPTRFALARGLGPLWPLHQALRCKYWIVACAAGPNSPLLALPGLIAYLPTSVLPRHATALHEHLRTTCPDSCCHTLRYLVQLPCLTSLRRLATDASSGRRPGAEYTLRCYSCSWAQRPPTNIPLCCHK